MLVTRVSNSKVRGTIEVDVVLAVSSSVTTRVTTADEEAVAWTYSVVGDAMVSVTESKTREVSSMTVFANTMRLLVRGFTAVTLPVAVTNTEGWFNN